MLSPTTILFSILLLFKLLTKSDLELSAEKQRLTTNRATYVIFKPEATHDDGAPDDR